MRIFERILFALILGATPVALPAFAFEGTPVGPQDTAIPVVAAQPGAVQALKNGVHLHMNPRLDRTVLDTAPTDLDQGK